jgi:hypothetical protein
MAAQTRFAVADGIKYLAESREYRIPCYMRHDARWSCDCHAACLTSMYWRRACSSEQSITSLLEVKLPLLFRGRRYVGTLVNVGTLMR